MSHRLTRIERDVLNDCYLFGHEIWDVEGIFAVVEAILLTRERRAQPAGTPSPRLRTVPPGKITPRLRLLRDFSGNLSSTTSLGP